MKAAFALLAVAITFPLLALAQPEPGTPYTFAIGTPAYDLTGPQDGGDDYVEVRATVTHLASGKLVGTATALYYADDYDLTATGPLTGKVSVRLATFTFKAPITGSDGGGNPVTGRYRLTGRAVREEWGEFEGTARGKACVFGDGCRSSGGYLYLEPSSSAWTLNFTNLQVNGATITGSAFARMTGNGRTFPYTVAGKFNSRTGLTTLKLKGFDTGASSSLVVRAANGFQLQRITGRLLGQTVKYAPGG